MTLVNVEVFPVADAFEAIRIFNLENTVLGSSRILNNKVKKLSLLSLFA